MRGCWSGGLEVVWKEVTRVIKHSFVRWWSFHSWVRFLKDVCRRGRVLSGLQHNTNADSNVCSKLATLSAEQLVSVETHLSQCRQTKSLHRAAILNLFFYTENVMCPKLRPWLVDAPHQPRCTRRPNHASPWQVASLYWLIETWRLRSPCHARCDCTVKPQGLNFLCCNFLFDSWSD